ncbi:hypothetical protein BGX21_004833 [Mortierella sp. AD011]|nr:hypothetical protein BGX21_004833 [Mortierella sp. AD011]
MTAIIASSARMIHAPLQAAARRQYSAAASSTLNASAQGPTQVVGHSNQRLAIASIVSAIAGADVTYAYFTYFKIPSMSFENVSLIGATTTSALAPETGSEIASPQPSAASLADIIGHTRFTDRLPNMTIETHE